MSVILLKKIFCIGDLDSLGTQPVDTAFKNSVFGRTVYRITYPIRELVSNLIMLPYTSTEDAVKATWQSLEERHIAIKAPLTFLAGLGALVGSLTVGTAISCTAGIACSILQAACESDINKMDTYLERTVRNKTPEVV